MIIEIVPLGDLRKGIEKLLAKKDGVDYVQKLLDEANRLFGAGYPHITNFWEGYDRITNAGGYQLEGFDHGWIEAGDRRAAFYTNLPPGSYRFRVLAGINFNNVGPDWGAR